MSRPYGIFSLPPSGGATGRECGRSRFGGPDLWAPALLVLLGILFFSDLLFTSNNLYYRDILNFHYPLRKILIDSYARWELPLWNPYVYFGQPMLANPNYMSFYPTNFFHLFLPFNYAFKLHFIIHPILGGLGVYCLLRRLSIGPSAAFGGAVIYQFSGGVLSFLNLYNIVPATALLPWMAWAFLSSLESGRVLHRLLFGALTALQIIAFEPIMVQCCLWLLAALSLHHYLQSGNRRAALATILRNGAGGGAFGVGLAAIQILPTLELLPLSARRLVYGFDMTAFWSLHPLSLLNLIVPNLFGMAYTIDGRLYWGEAFNFGREGYIVSIFVGAAAMLTAMLSFLSPRKKLPVIAAGLATASTVLSLGSFSPVYGWLYRTIPLFRLGRYPSKYVLLTTLAVAVMASLGLEALQKREPRTLRVSDPAFLIGAAGLLLSGLLLGASFCFRNNPRDLAAIIVRTVNPDISQFKDYGEIAAVISSSLGWSGLSALTAGLLIIISLFMKRRALTVCLLILATGLGPAVGNRRLTPLISGEDFNFVSDMVRHLGARASQALYRIEPIDPPDNFPIHLLRGPDRDGPWLSLFYRQAGEPFYGITNGIQYGSFISVDYLNTSESNELLRPSLGSGRASTLLMAEKTNTRYLLTRGRIDFPTARLEASFDTVGGLKANVYALDNALPRAYFVTSAESAASGEEAYRKFTGAEFPFRSRVIVQDSHPTVELNVTGTEQVKVLDYRNSYFSCQTASESEGYLVLLDSYYPGWIAFVDGRKTPILKANYAFRAVHLAAGRHTVEFRYRPWSFYAGAAVTLLTMVIGAAFLLRRGR